ncbi:MAG: sugar phosphate nucleotidyltransferase, partial [Leptospira sp.]|nr:sugar phosphate nucleotidyltransferase [Leptospira sp.]
MRFQEDSIDCVEFILKKDEVLTVILGGGKGTRLLPLTEKRSKPAVSFGRENQFDLNYLLPFTFLRSMEQQSGSPDNALVGLNVKANVHPQVQLYGQVLLDEFKLSEIRAQSGWWANKFGYQIGVKYIDAFNLPNLDLQLEANRVRPFTYTHFDSISNYSNNGLAMAH